MKRIEREKSTEEHSSTVLLKKRKELIARIAEFGGLDFLQRHSWMLDDYFRARFEKSTVGPYLRIDANPYAIIALGGYGREEQCVHSDVDLLFLFQKHVPKEAEALIQEVVYPLWDIGLEVGYAVRTVNESLGMCKKDFEVLTPLLDARLVCGMSPVFLNLMEAVRGKLLSKHSDDIVRWLVETNQDRHRRFGDSTYLLEPNLKEGQGGLRDYHTMLWIARIKLNLAQPRDLEYLGCLSHREFESLFNALFFIWNVRNRLHLMAGRKMDQLLFENQINLSDMMGFKRKNGQEPVEVFLSVLHTKMEFIKQQHLIFLDELGFGKKFRRQKAGKQMKYPDIAIENESLYFSSSEAILRSPELLIRIFEESMRLKIRIRVEAKRLIEEFAYLFDEGYAASPTVVRSFERILAAPAVGFGVLKEMLNTGLLVRLIPEFKGVVNRIQYDAYHLYPVDLHLIRAVQTVSRFGLEGEDDDDPIYRQVFREIKNRSLLFWAALLHDIGKGKASADHAEKGAEIARNVMTSKGYSLFDTDTVSFLVREHLFLIKTATRRDIQDEETAVFCARRIRDIERLKMLYLLTVADSMATGPKAWSSWTAALMRDLFLKTLQVLEKGELATQEVVEKIEMKKTTILGSIPDTTKKKQMEALFQVMPPHYLIYSPTQDIIEHARMYRSLGEKRFIWKVVKGKDPATRTIVICAKDRPGLFSRIAGVFTLNGIDILDAQAYTWKNQTALDIFVVKPPSDLIFEDERWATAHEHLNSALNGILDLSEALKNRLSGERRARIRRSGRPCRVIVDNKSSGFFTIVEVFADDFPGLLYSITNALFNCRLDIHVAKISTKVDQVVDVFYVRDLFGQKVDTPEQESHIRLALEKVLQRPDSGRSW
ncbi:MAG: [protein-PII] uridylyltransferase [Pseudomonadota bacterium]